MVTPLSLDNLFTPATADEWNDEELSLANTLDLPTTTWQPGGVERVIFATVANVQQESDVAASIINQARFLDFAATGSVTYATADGETVTTLVTPDPSIPSQNPTGALGWLDVLSDSVYNVQRILLTFAGGTLGIVNTSVSTYGPFSAGTYRVTQPGATGSPGYTNTADLTIPPTAQVGGAVISSILSAGGLIEVTTGVHGLSDGDEVMIVGALGVPQLFVPYVVWAITVTSPSTFTLDGSAFAGAWTGTGSAYEPQLADFIADTAGTASNVSAAGLVYVPVTSLIGVTVNNTGPWLGSDTESNEALAARCRLKLQSLSPDGPSGAYEYFALSSQSLALNVGSTKVASAITRALVTVDAVGTVTVTIANAAGAPGSSDVTVTDAVIQQYAVPVSVTETTQAAEEHDIAVVITVFLPSAYNTTANETIFTAAVESFFQSLPIGGVILGSGTSPDTNVVPFDGVIGSVFVAAKIANIPLKTGDVQGTLDAATANIQLLLTPVPEVATISTITMNIVSV